MSNTFEWAQFVFLNSSVSLSFMVNTTLFSKSCSVREGVSSTWEVGSIYHDEQQSFAVFVHLNVWDYCMVLEYDDLKCLILLLEILISNDTTSNPPKSCPLSFFWRRPHNHPYSISDSSKRYHSNCFWKMETSISEQWPDTRVITHPCHRMFFLYTLALILARFLQIGLAQNTFLKVFFFFLHSGFSDHLVQKDHTTQNIIKSTGKGMSTFSCGERFLSLDLEK